MSNSISNTASTSSGNFGQTFDQHNVAFDSSAPSRVQSIVDGFTQHPLADGAQQQRLTNYYTDLEKYYQDELNDLQQKPQPNQDISVGTSPQDLNDGATLNAASAKLTPGDEKLIAQQMHAAFSGGAPTSTSVKVPQEAAALFHQTTGATGTGNLDPNGPNLQSF